MTDRVEGRVKESVGGGDTSPLENVSVYHNLQTDVARGRFWYCYLTRQTGYWVQNSLNHLPFNHRLTILFNRISEYTVCLQFVVNFLI